MNCPFKDSCKKYEYACEAKLLVQCPDYHTHSLVSFTRRFQEVFLCSLSKPTLSTNRVKGSPIYAYTPQALYNAVVSEFSSLCKYSYSFMPISSLVTKAMAEEMISESIVIVSSEYRTVADSFVVPLTESCIWSSQHRPTFVLLPRGFTPPPTWTLAK